MIPSSPFRLAFSGYCTLALAACTNVGSLDLPLANPFAAKVPFVVPAASSAAASIRALSVVPLGSPGSQQLAQGVEGDLIKLKFQEAPYYEKVVLEDPVNAPALGAAQQQGIVNRSSTQGIAALRYLGANVARRSYQETRTDCSKKTALFQMCPRDAQVTRQVSCEERSAVASAELRVYDRNSNKTVLSDTVNGSYIDNRCSDSTASANPDNALIGAALQQLQKRILTTLAPSVDMRPLDLMEPDRAVAAAMVPQFQQALSFARAKRLDEACARFADLYDAEKESAALTYNNGFCDEARGDLAAAVTRYKRASELFGQPNTQIDRHMTASEKAIKEIGIVTVAALPQREDAASRAAYVPTGRRVALVIGNARYEKGALINPVNDARLIETSLRKLGFQVVKAENLNNARLRTMVDDFAAKAKGADVALFYYAGHAVQAGGENYLLPVDDLAIHSEDDLRGHALPLATMLAKLSVPAGPHVKLLFIDACRDNPLPSASRSLAGGLAPMAPPPKGSLIVFATAPGSTASDGSGKNSIFTKNFAAAVDTPGLKVEDMLKQVRSNVLRDSKNKQEPSEVSSLTGDFYFRPAP
jgi:hypothetical protein